MRLTYLLMLALAGLLAGCASDFNGDVSPNKPPVTRLTADTIILNGNDRLGTRLHLRWWGDDEDGLVTGYEFTFDSILGPSTVWQFTTQNDSIFLLTIPAGVDTFNFRIAIRAVDNDGARDPKPATLGYPSRNAPPSVNFTYLPDNGNPLAGGNPKTSFPVIRYTWEAQDDDGLENIGSFEFCLNDTTVAPLVIPGVQRSMIIQGNNLNGNTTDCNVFPGSFQIPFQDKLNGMKLNDSNTLYIRVVDLSLAKSKWVAANTIFVRKPTSQVLLVNAYNNTASGYAELNNFYRQQLASSGISSVDTLNLLEKEGGRFVNLAASNRTQSLIFSMFKSVIWYGQDADFSLAYGTNTLTELLNKGGKVLMSTFVSGATSPKEQAYDFTPIDSLLTPPTGSTFIMVDTSTCQPLQNGWPQLQYSQFQPVVRPMKLIGGAQPLYNGRIIRRIGVANFSAWTGPSCVMAIRANATTGSEIIFSTLELHKLNNQNNIGQFFAKLKDEFGL